MLSNVLPVHFLIVLAAGGPADIHTAVRPHVERIAVSDVPVLIHDGRIQQGERERVARQHRQILHHAALNGGGHGGGIKFHGCDAGIHFNVGSDGADGHGGVHGDVTAREYGDFFLDVFLKARAVTVME